MISKNDKGILSPSKKSPEEVLAEIPEELRTEDTKSVLKLAFSQIASINKGLESGNSEVDRIKAMQESGEGIFADSDDDACSFSHQMPDKTFASVFGWAKKNFKLDAERANFAFNVWNEYIKYEHERQTSAVVLKAIKKPDLVIVSIAPWTDRETIKKMAKNDADRKKAERLSAAMSVQGQGDFTFFEGYKKVPCGIVAMTFNDVYYLKDFGMVVRGAKFHPDRKK